MKVAILHSLRLLKHELRRGELTIIALAIILSVSAVFSLSGFSGQIKQSLLENSTKFIAADRILKAPRELDDKFLQSAAEHDLQVVKQAEMASMVFAGDEMLLTQIKATTDGYPLRGQLLVKTSMSGQATPHFTPKANQVWLDKKAFVPLKVKIGDELEVGNITLTIAGLIEQLPDASFSVFTSAPVVIVNYQDLAATELVQPGSRLGYHYLFSGQQADLETYEEWLKPQLNETQHWRDIKSGNSPLARSLNRAELYLSLSSMLGIILAAVAVAVATRRYGQRHQTAVAIFKALGASKKHIIRVYSLHWGLLSILSIAVGLVIGAVLLNLGMMAISGLFEITTTPNYRYPIFVSILTGVICASAFALQPLLALVNTSPMMILRGSTKPAQNLILTGLLSLAAVFVLLYVFSQNALLSVSLLVGLVTVSGILMLVGFMLMKLGRSVGTKAGKAWHLALANLKRRAKENSVQLISFTIAIKLLLLIVVMKNAIIDEWQAQLPSDAPNRFLINISQQQEDAFEQFIVQNNISSSGLYPVVRGRLIAINNEKVGKKVTKEQESEADNGRAGVGRELNLTWRFDLPKQNTVLDGKWWPTENNIPVAPSNNRLADDDNQSDESAYVSIESSLAQRLNISLEDTLTFNIGSQVIDVKVQSIREVNWQSLQPNFYMILHPSVLADFPATYISSLHLASDQQSALQQFLAQHPTISMLDVDAMIKQLREVIEQVSVAIQFILVLVILAGSLVLVAQVQASMEERERELAILRTLGAKGKILTLSIFYEFLALGALAGLMASFAMEVAVYLIQTQVFEMQPSFHFAYWLLGIVSGAGFVAIIGVLSCWRLLNLTSAQLIRRTM
ncbi:MAG: ABC transporter permease [Thalassotalea sp.]